MRGSTVNARKLHYRVVEVSTCHFRVVPAQARPKMRARPWARHGPRVRAVFRIMPKYRAMTRPQMARPMSQLYTCYY